MVQIRPGLICTNVHTNQSWSYLNHLVYEAIVFGTLVYKSETPGVSGEYIFYVGASYSWVSIVELDTCHLSDP